MIELEFAPEVANLPLHSDSELKDLTQSILEHGFKEHFPIIVFDNQIYDGRNRYRAAQLANVEPAVKYCYSKREALKLAEMSYLQRVYTLEQKVQVKAHFSNLRMGRPSNISVSKRSETNQKTINELAIDAGVSEAKMKKAVSVKNAVENGSLSIEVRNRILRGDDTNNNAYEAMQLVDKAAKKTVGNNEDKEAIKRISRQLSEDAADLANKSDISILKATKMVLNEKVVVNGHTIGDNDSEWYTPVYLTDSARRVMGSIDIDPASNEFSQNRIQAGTYYTAETNGLDKEWKGNVWLNPPYGKSSDEQAGCADFINKLLDECEGGNVGEYLVLVNSSNGTDWYERMCENCTMMGLSRKRIQFDRHPNALIEKKDQNTKGQTLFYFGENVGEFIHEYIDLFNVMQPLNLNTAVIDE